MKVLIIDNYDSFTYNIAHIVKAISSANIEIIKAGELNLNEVDKFDKILFSPGPDMPRRGNIMESVLESYESTKSIIGICLGLQAIVLFYGGKLTRLDQVAHGREIEVKKTGSESIILKTIPDTFRAGVYHSWIADPGGMPSCLSITCYSTQGRIMGVRHTNYDIEAVQFHPESIMTPLGHEMIYNWLRDRLQS